MIQCQKDSVVYSSFGKAKDASALISVTRPSSHVGYEKIKYFYLVTIGENQVIDSGINKIYFITWFDTYYWCIM